MEFPSTRTRKTIEKQVYVQRKQVWDLLSLSCQLEMSSSLLTMSLEFRVMSGLEYRLGNYRYIIHLGSN